MHTSVILAAGAAAIIYIVAAIITLRANWSIGAGLAMLAYNAPWLANLILVLYILFWPLFCLALGVCSLIGEVRKRQEKRAQVTVKFTMTKELRAEMAELQQRAGAADLGDLAQRAIAAYSLITDIKSREMEVLVRDKNGKINKVDFP